MRPHSSLNYEELRSWPHRHTGVEYPHSKPAILPVLFHSTKQHNEPMKLFLVSVILFFLALSTPRAEAVIYLYDASGTPMQRNESRMPDSPVANYPGLLGPYYWPFLPSPYSPLAPIINILVETPEVSVQPEQPKHRAPAKFWLAHCGMYVEMNIDAITNVTEEEAKPCTPEQTDPAHPASR